MSVHHVFERHQGAVPRVVRASGAQMWDDAGRRYLDMCGGAIVVGIGHGVAAIAQAMAQQASTVAYAHGSAFNSAALDDYCDALAPLLPMDNPAIYPVSGGSEANETALKMARAYHLARGEDRPLIISRRLSYHGNTRGALSVSDRPSLRAPYLPWLDATAFTTTPNPYRPRVSGEPDGDDGSWHAQQLDDLLRSVGPERVAAFIAEPVSGATLGAVVPPDQYWSAMTEVCRRHGVLVIADEVMTGFGRTGRWFGADHWGLRPDILTAGKGVSSGYWPLGLAVASGQVAATIASAGFVHGFTYSHHVVGAAVGHAVLTHMQENSLVTVAEKRGEEFGALLRDRLEDLPQVGDIRGLGMLRAVELVRDRASKECFDRSEKVTERITAACKEAGVLVYPCVGAADGREGDALLFGPPLDTPVEQLDEAVTTLESAIRRVLG